MPGDWPPGGGAVWKPLRGMIPKVNQELPRVWHQLSLVSIWLIGCASFGTDLLAHLEIGIERNYRIGVEIGVVEARGNS
jgi:hypothetical protein